MSIELSPPKTGALILAGPTVLGLCLSLRPNTTLTEGFTLPFVLLAVTAVMLPALYIGAGLLEIAPEGDAIVRGAIEGLVRCSWACLGLAPAVAFMVGTSTSAVGAALVAYGFVAVAVCLGLRGLFERTFGHGVSARVFFFFWSFVSLGIGARLFTTVMLGGQ